MLKLKSIFWGKILRIAISQMKKGTKFVLIINYNKKSDLWASREILENNGIMAMIVKIGSTLNRVWK